MNRAKASRLVAIWFALALGVEVFGACGYFVRLRGGLLPLVPGPVSVLIVDKQSEYSSSAYKPFEEVLSSSRVIAWLNAHCPKEDGAPSWRHWDRDTAISKEGSRWSPLLEKCRAEMDKAGVNAPVIAIVGRTSSTVQPLPASEDETLALLKKWGGE